MYNKYLIKYNYSDGTKPINFLIYNYIFLLYKNKNDIFFFKKILIITLDNKLYLKILNKIIKILKKLSNTNYKKLLITKKIKKKLFITYKEINIFSKIILNNFIRYYKKIPIYNFNIFFYYLYKKKINYYFSKIYFFKKKNLLIFLNYIFKKKNINTDYIKKIFLKKIYLGYYYIIKYLIKNIKKILNNNKFLYGESKNNINHKYIYKKITYYILKIKNIKKTIYNNKKKFYLFLKKKQINIHSFIYNDIYKLFEKKINYTFFKKVYFNNLFLNKRLKKNLKNNIFYSKTQNNFIKKNIDKNKNKIKKYIYNYEKIIKKYSLKYILLKRYIKFNIFKLYITLIINKYSKKLLLYKYVYTSKRFIKIYDKYHHFFLYGYENITYNKWRLFKIIINNLLYIGRKIYIWGDFNKNYGEEFNYLKEIKFNNYIIYEKNIRKNFINNFFIVLFYNNLLFFINKKYKNIYNNSLLQLPQKKNNGYIEINIINYKNDIYINIIKKIKFYLEHGYKYNDIIILLRNNIEVNNYILNLNKKNTFLKNIIFKNFIYLNDLIHIKILIEFLKCILYKNISKHRLNLILLLNQINYFNKLKIKKKIFYKNIYYFFKFFKKKKIYISYNLLLKINLYDKVEYIIKQLNFNRSIYTKLLDIIYEFEKKYPNNIYRFIKNWEKNKKKIYNLEDFNYNNKKFIKILSISENKNKYIYSKIIILPLLSWNIFYNKNKWIYDIVFYKKINKNYINQFILKKQIDNFNILYKLITRAINKLIIYLKKNDNKYNIYYLFMSFLKYINIWKNKKKIYYFGFNKIINKNKKLKKKYYLFKNKINLKYYNNKNLIKKKNIKKKYIKFFISKIDINNYNNKIKIIKKEFYYNKKILRINNIIKINNIIYIIKIIKNKIYNIYNIINYMYNNILIFKRIYNNNYIYKIIIYIFKKKIKYYYYL